MKINWEVSFGNLLTLLLIGVSVVAAFVTVQADMHATSRMLNAHEERLDAGEAALRLLDRDGTAYDRHSLIPRLQRMENDIREIKTDIQKLLQRR